MTNFEVIAFFNFFPSKFIPICNLCVCGFVSLFCFTLQTHAQDTPVESDTPTASATPFAEEGAAESATPVASPIASDDTILIFGNQRQGLESLPDIVVPTVTPTPPAIACKEAPGGETQSWVDDDGTQYTVTYSGDMEETVKETSDGDSRHIETQQKVWDCYRYVLDYVWLDSYIQNQTSLGLNVITEYEVSFEERSCEPDSNDEDAVLCSTEFEWTETLERSVLPSEQQPTNRSISLSRTTDNELEEGFPKRCVEVFQYDIREVLDLNGNRPRDLAYRVTKTIEVKRNGRWERDDAQTSDWAHFEDFSPEAIESWCPFLHDGTIVSIADYPQ